MQSKYWTIIAVLVALLALSIGAGVATQGNAADRGVALSATMDKSVASSGQATRLFRHDLTILFVARTGAREVRSIKIPPTARFAVSYLDLATREWVEVQIPGPEITRRGAMDYVITVYNEHDLAGEPWWWKIEWHGPRGVQRADVPMPVFLRGNTVRYEAAPVSAGNSYTSIAFQWFPEPAGE